MHQETTHTPTYTRVHIVRDGWRTYRAAVIPANAPDNQVEQCLMSFYAGATVLFFGLLAAISPEKEVTNTDVGVMKSILAELTEFKESVIAMNPNHHS